MDGNDRRVCGGMLANGRRFEMSDDLAQIWCGDGMYRQLKDACGEACVPDFLIVNAARKVGFMVEQAARMRATVHRSYVYRCNSERAL